MYYEFKWFFFNKAEKRTKVDKNTIVSLAEKLQNNGLKDENTIREIIDTLSMMTGKKVSKEKSDKIVAKVKGDSVPNNIDKMF